MTKQANSTYQKAIKDAESINNSNPVKLGLSINYAVFMYKVLEKKQKAIEFALKALQCGVKELTGNE